MPRFNAQNIINRLKGMSDIDKSKKANSDTIIKDEIDNVMEDTKISLYRQSREKAAKYALWQGLLNQYGLFGTQRSNKRIFGRNKDINYYDREYLHGDLVSIDFGTSNLDKEFSFTHTAIVIKSYTDYIVVLPTTSCKEGRLENRPQDEQDDTMIITSGDFEDIESDSYIMLYQIRSVSKNRIQKIIGTISNTQLMKRIDDKVSEAFSPIVYHDFHSLKEQYDDIKSQNELLRGILDEIKKDANSILTHTELYDKISTNQ